MMRFEGASFAHQRPTFRQLVQAHGGLVFERCPSGAGAEGMGGEDASVDLDLSLIHI